MDFAKNASFESYGVICLPPLPSTLPEELSMDKRNNSELFLRQRVCMLSDSFCRTTDSSLFSMNNLLKALSLYHGLAHVVTLCIAQLHTVCILVVTPVAASTFSLVPRLSWGRGKESLHGDATSTLYHTL